MLAGVLGVTAMFRRERNIRLKQQDEALRDRTTGLANRASFDELLDAAARRCARRDTSAALLLLDLNHFKEVNDTHGHACGDAVLKAFAERVSACVREADTVARIGGDEFAVLLADPSSLNAAHTVAAELRKALRGPLGVPDVGELEVSASSGAATFGNGITAARALADADLAMYADKAAWSRERAQAQH
jgi:diguanylate cyclase (GGDEF)-like protein